MSLIGKLVGGKSAPNSGSLSRAEILESLRKVRTEDQCRLAFQELGLLDGNGLNGKDAEFLIDCVKQLRSEGLGLEPNLVGRSATQLINERRNSGDASVLFAEFDSDFEQALKNARHAGQSHNHPEAEFNFWQALCLYPFHPSCRVQYAHALKDQGKYWDSVPQYFNAVCLGAPGSDVADHLIFAAEQIGIHDEVSRKLASVETLVFPLDVTVVHELFLGRLPSSEEQTRLVLSAGAIEDVMVMLVESGEFRHQNKDLVRLIAETNWGAESA